MRRGNILRGEPAERGIRLGGSETGRRRRRDLETLGFCIDFLTSLSYSLEVGTGRDGRDCSRSSLRSCSERVSELVFAVNRSLPTG